MRKIIVLLLLIGIVLGMSVGEIGEALPLSGTDSQYDVAEDLGGPAPCGGEGAGTGGGGLPG